MLFSEFCRDNIILESGNVFALNEGIDHIEALPVDKFISAIERMADFIATEKLDGSNLIFGFENDGRFYTSREAKSGGRFYTDDDYENTPANNGFKTAHQALNQVKSRLRKVMDPGEACEVEVLFGRQPNAIVYGSSYIAFLRMLPGDTKSTPDQDKVKQLDDTMKGVTVTVDTEIMGSKDGVELTNIDIKTKWKFVSTSYVDSKHFKKVDVDKEIRALKKWMKQDADIKGLGIQNGELIGVKLTSVPKDIRPAVKKAREDAIKYLQDNLKLPIKEKLLDDIIRKLSPVLRDVEIMDHEDTGVEGVVLLNPKTLEQFKIVDKDVFTIINQFNYAIRNEIKSAVSGRMKFDGATIGHQDMDIFGSMLKDVADALHIPELARYTQIKRTLSKSKGDNREETLAKVSKRISHTPVDRLKVELGNAVDEGLTKLKKGLDKYNRNWKDFKLKLKTGKEIKYTDEIHSRTLTTFAEVRKELMEIKDQISNAKTHGDLIMALYGKQIKSMH